MAYAAQFMWTKMLKSEFEKVHMVKCIVYSFVKGKDVIMGPNLTLLKNMQQRQRPFIIWHI